MADHFDRLLSDIRACRVCDADLPAGCRPVIQMSKKAKILVVGQAPGRRVHESGIPFDDPSGDRLRRWMGVDKTVFYNPDQINIVPMGFCYPGTGASGDLPPRPECASQWRSQVMAQMQNVELTLVIGRYAIDWHLGKQQGRNLTETVRNWRSYWPDQVVLPHPSPRNNMWFKRNDWFEAELVPAVQGRISALLPL